MGTSPIKKDSFCPTGVPPEGNKPTGHNEESQKIGSKLLLSGKRKSEEPVPYHWKKSNRRSQNQQIQLDPYHWKKSNRRSQN